MVTMLKRARVTHRTTGCSVCFCVLVVAMHADNHFNTKHKPEESIMP